MSIFDQDEMPWSHLEPTLVQPTYLRILADEERLATMFGRGSEVHMVSRAHLRREAWAAIQREHGYELRILVEALFDALLGWTR